MKLVCILGLVAAAASAQSSNCDRACLEGFVDQYLDAVTAHNPKLLPLAANVKFTENGQKLEPGDGLWNSMTGKGSYRLFVTMCRRDRWPLSGRSAKKAGIPAKTYRRPSRCG